MISEFVFFGRIFSVSVGYWRFCNILGISERIRSLIISQNISQNISQRKIPTIFLRYSFGELWNTVAILAQASFASPSLPHLLTTGEL